MAGLAVCEHGIWVKIDDSFLYLAAPQRCHPSEQAAQLVSYGSVRRNYRKTAPKREGIRGVFDAAHEIVVCAIFCNDTMDRVVPVGRLGRFPV